MPEPIDFFEIAPENMLGIGGKRRKDFEFFQHAHPFICHGLSLSLGSPSPLDKPFILQLKKFFKEFNITIYSEHLSYCSDGGHLYDLLPIPFTEEAVHYVAGRIQQTQDILERTIAVENVSYYCAPGQEISELEFINAVLQESQCELLLDINNLYVNSINQGYDPELFLSGLNPETIAYIHMAGHTKEHDRLLIDTHGENIIEPVWALLEKAYDRLGPVPTLLERDFNFPPLSDLLTEVSRIKHLQHKTLETLHE